MQYFFYNFFIFIFLIENVLAETDLAVCLYSFHTLLKAKLTAIEAKIIIHGIGPEMARVMIVVVGTILILFCAELLQLFSLEGLNLAGLLHKEIVGRMDKYRQNIVIVLKNEVRCSFRVF